MADFSNIKVGDKIKYYPRFWGDYRILQPLLR